MPLELKVPSVGESITEVQIGAWLKRVGDTVRRDESLVEIESDKATAELPSPVDGVLTQVLKQRGEKAQVGETIAYMEEKGAATSAAPAEPTSGTAGQTGVAASPAKPDDHNGTPAAKSEPRPVVPPNPTPTTVAKPAAPSVPATPPPAPPRRVTAAGGT